jgi:hypothetical protein
MPLHRWHVKYLFWYLMYCRVKVAEYRSKKEDIVQKGDYIHIQRGQRSGTLRVRVSDVSYVKTVDEYYDLQGTPLQQYLGDQVHLYTVCTDGMKALRVQYFRHVARDEFVCPTSSRWVNADEDFVVWHLSYGVTQAQYPRKILRLLKEW